MPTQVVRIGLLALCALLSLTACKPANLVVRTELVDVPVRQYVPVPDSLTGECPSTPKPSPKCIDSGRPALCNPQLIEWREATQESLDECNSRLARIRELQRQIGDK